MPDLTRRELLLAAGGVGVGALTPSVLSALSDRTVAGIVDGGSTADIVRAGRLRQSVARWCYSDVPLDDLCRASRDIGLVAVDLLAPEEWETAHRHELVVSCGDVGAGTIEDGLNEPANHRGIIAAFERWIPEAAAANVPNVICFFGNRRGMDLSDGIRNSIACLRECAPIAEEHGVTILVELLNSTVSHADYIGDHTAYGAEVIRSIDSPRVGILYDIYHMQVMEGDVIRTIRDNRDIFRHYHTGGVPGRAEIDDTQELGYVGIAKAIADLSFDGYVAHEFIPKGPDPLAALRAGALVCTV